MTSGSDDLEQELRRNLKLRRELGAEAAKMFSCVCLEGKQELVRSLLKRTLAAEKFANQIANQPCKSRIASEQRRKIVFS